MRIIPVMDVRDGNVLRAVGGNRAEYEPLISDLCATGEPLPFAFTLKERFGFDECYVADLNAIAGGAPDLELFAGLVELGLLPWVDAGIRTAAQAMRVRATGASVIVGSETLDSIDAWESIVRAIDPRRIALSLDLHNGRLINEPLGESDPRRLVERLLAAADEIRAPGVARLIVLDLARVGQGKGAGTERLVSELARTYLDCEVIAGGGVRHDIDIERLEREGAAGVLVSSALHSGAIQPHCNV